MNRFLLSALAAGTIFAGTAAWAQSAPPTPPAPPAGHRFFDEMDANKDGVLTRAEMTSVLEKRFAELDTDRNGSISRAERQAMHEKRENARIDARFATMDTDKNGQISRQEMHAAADARPEAGRPGKGHGFARRDHGGWDRGGRDKGEMAGRTDGPQGNRAPIEITKEAFMKRAMARFDRIDSNDDDKITAAERDAAGGPMRPMHPGRPAPKG